MLVIVDTIMYFRVFFFQAEDGIRDLVRSRGLGDVYKRQLQPAVGECDLRPLRRRQRLGLRRRRPRHDGPVQELSLIHI